MQCGLWQRLVMYTVSVKMAQLPESIRNMLKQIKALGCIRLTVCKWTQLQSTHKWAGNNFVD